jgi:hypothetical protein
MKALPSTGPAHGAMRPPLISGRIKPGTSLADRQRLGMARVVFLHFLEQDDRLAPGFDTVSRRLGLTRSANGQRRRLTKLVVRNARAIYNAMLPIARDTLGLQPAWIQRELFILYCQHLGLTPGDPLERGPFDEPAPARVKIDFRPFPGSTIREARREAEQRLDALLPAATDVDSSHAPREAGRYLADYAWWFYLRRCVRMSERQVATKIARTSRARITKGVKEVERLFSLVTESTANS